MKLVHVAEDIAPISGGVPAVVRQLATRSASAGIAVSLIHARGEGEDLPGVCVTAAPPSTAGSTWDYSSALAEVTSKVLSEAASGASVAHIHGIWKAPQFLAARESHRRKVPFIVTPHGMLDSWLWRRQGLGVWVKKIAYWQFVVCKALSRAAVVHALTPHERDSLKALFPLNKIEVIPNAVSVEANLPKRDYRGKRRIIFLGRLEPKKGVDILLRAFAAARLEKDWSLDIVGPPHVRQYANSLQQLARELGISDRVNFHGALFGREKDAVLDSARFMVSPSRSEGLAMVNLEAAARGLTAITTPASGLYDWNEGGGVLVAAEVEAFTRALLTASSWSDQEIERRGSLSHCLVRERYSWESTLPKWLELYSSLATR